MSIEIQNQLLPSDGFVRLPVILQCIPVGKSTWWAGVKSGRFPKAIKLSSRTTVWRVEDIRQLMADINQESGDAED
jgi:prophage regulatory protein